MNDFVKIYFHEDDGEIVWIRDIDRNAYWSIEDLIGRKIANLKMSDEGILILELEES